MDKAPQQCGAFFVAKSSKYGCQITVRSEIGGFTSKVAKMSFWRQLAPSTVPEMQQEQNVVFVNELL